LGASSPIRTLIEPGVALQQIEVADDPGLLTVSVSVPYSIDVREYVDSVTDAIDTVELLAKYEPASSREMGSELTSDTDERLTERQREVVRVAFYAGYYDQPRTADAETVAAELGIAQSTFSQHLRAAERKLLEALYD
jgi:predicted DNA binding protein